MRLAICPLILFSILPLAWSDNDIKLPYHKTTAAIQTRSNEIIWVLRITRQNNEKIQFIDVSGAKMSIDRKLIKKIYTGVALQRLKYQRHKEQMTTRKKMQQPADPKKIFRTLPFISLNRRCAYNDPRSLKQFFGFSENEIHLQTVSAGSIKGLQLKDEWDFQYRLVGDFKFWVRGPKLNVLEITIGDETVTVGRPDVNNKEFEVCRKDNEVVIWSQLRRKKLWSGTIQDREVCLAIAAPTVDEQYLPKKQKLRRQQYWDPHRHRMVTRYLDENGRVVRNSSSRQRSEPSVFIGNSYCPIIREVHVWGKIENPDYKKSDPSPNN